MKITIDTKEDDVEDIKKLIAMLNSLISGRTNSNEFNSDTPAFANMFGQKEEVKEKEDEKDSEEKTEEVKVVEY